MSNKVKFKLNLSGLNEVMKRPELQAMMQAKGEEIAARAEAAAENPKAEYYAVTKTIRWIAVTDVRCGNSEAVYENLKNNTLLKSLH